MTPRSRPRLRFLALIVAVPLLLYPIVTAGGTPPVFVHVSECSDRASPGETRELEIVYGRFADQAAADELAERARAMGYRDTLSEPDGCGRWKAVNGAVDSYEGGRDAVEEGRRAGLEGELELAVS